MEKITVFLALFIFIYLIYSYFSYKKKILKENIKEKKEAIQEKNDGNTENYEKHILAAVIASIMDGKKYKIRNIFLEKDKETKKSTWKIAGRNYNMQRRDRM